MDTFRFSDNQWDEISAQLARTGRLKYEGDREMLEMICGHFAQLYPRLRRNASTPKRARAAWRKVAVAASKLQIAIIALRVAGAADFSILDAHQAGTAKWNEWSRQLKLLKQNADWAAELEMAGAQTVSNNADPMRNGLLKQLATIWKAYGGKISHGDGPLIQFLTAVTTPVFKKPLTDDAIKGVVRGIAKEEKRAEKARRLAEEEERRLAEEDARFMAS